MSTLITIILWLLVVAFVLLGLALLGVSYTDEARIGLGGKFMSWLVFFVGLGLGGYLVFIR